MSTNKRLAPYPIIRQRHVSFFGDIREHYNITQKEIAALAKVSVQTVLRAEQGLHPNLSPPVAKALSELINEHGGNVSADSLCKHYLEDRKVNISRFQMDLISAVGFQDVKEKAFDLVLNDFNLNRVLSPVARFRTMVFEAYGLPSSAIKFCLYTGLHTATLEQAEVPSRLLPWENLSAVAACFADVFAFTSEEITQLGKLHDHYYLLARASD